MWKLPTFVSQFATKAALDVLPTRANLARWHVDSDSACICGAKETLLHALNGCEYKLERFKWRHNSVLSYIASEIGKRRPAWALMVDLPGKEYRLPFQIEQQYRPDIILRNGQELIFVELTIPFEDGFEQAHSRKEKKYQSGIIEPAKAAGFSPKLFCVEVGSRGKLAPSWKKIDAEFKLGAHVSHTCMTISVRASHYIWVTRHEHWELPPLVTG